jgi:hypothetical protein
MLKKIFVMLTAAGVAVTAMLAAQADPEDMHEHNHDMHMQHQHQGRGAAVTDSRTLVHFPDNLRIHTLANMRDHLLTLGEIQTALANEEFDKAGEIAEQRLGMTSLKLHGAHEVAPYMPKAMQDMGTAMHHSASRFAVTAGDAAVSGDVKPALAALSKVTQSCVACHSSFRLQ